MVSKVRIHTGVLVFLPFLLDTICTASTILPSWLCLWPFAFAPFPSHLYLCTFSFSFTFCTFVLLLFNLCMCTFSFVPSATIHPPKMPSIIDTILLGRTTILPNSSRASLSVLVPIHRNRLRVAVICHYKNKACISYLERGI